MDAIVNLERVSKHFMGDRVLAVDRVLLTVDRGEFVAVLGPSGSGKSTLLHLIGGIESPDAGRVLIDGVEPRSTTQWARVRAEKIGFVFQAFHLIPTLTALENVEIPLFGMVAGHRQRVRRATELLEMVGLAQRGRHRPCELSGGERQRVAIARSLANAPALLLADEPTGNLDIRTSREILEIFDHIHRQQGTTLILVTHEPGITSHAGRIIRFLDGRIVADERPAPVDEGGRQGCGAPQEGAGSCVL